MTLTNKNIIFLLTCAAIIALPRLSFSQQNSLSKDEIGDLQAEALTSDNPQKTQKAIDKLKNISNKDTKAGDYANQALDNVSTQVDNNNDGVKESRVFTATDETQSIDSNTGPNISTKPEASRNRYNSSSNDNLFYDDKISSQNVFQNTQSSTNNTSHNNKKGSLLSGDNVEYDYPDGEKGSPFGNSPTPASEYAKDGANFGESFSNDVSKGVSDFKRDGGKLIDKAGSLFGGGDSGGDDFQGVAGSVPMGNEDGADGGFLGNSTSGDSFGGVADSVPMGNGGGSERGGLFSGNNVEYSYPDGEKGSPFGNSPTPASEYAKGDTVGETFVNAADKGLSDLGNDAGKVADKVGGLFGGGDNGGSDFQGVAGSVPMGNTGSPNAPGIDNVAGQIASVDTGNFGGQDVISGVATGGSTSGIAPHDFGGKAKGVANGMVQSGAGKFPLKKFQKGQELTGQLGKAAAMGKDISNLNLNNVGQKAGGMAKNMAISEVKSQIGNQLGGMDIGSIGSMDMKGIQQTAGSMPGMSTIASDVTNAAKQAGSKIKSLGSDIASNIGGALGGLF